MRKILSHKNLLIGAVITLLMIIMAIAAPLIAPFDPVSDADLMNSELPPSAEFWFGTDTHGRDVFSRTVYGARISLSVGLVTQIINTFIGVSLGLIAGYMGRFWDDLIMGMTNIMLSIPVIVFALAIMAALGPGLFNIYLALGLTNWAYTCRITRAQVLSAKKNDYVKAAKALGYGRVRIMFTQIMPNVLGPILVIATLGSAEAILLEAALSFLGLGAQPPTPSWGGMLSSSRDLLFTAPWLSLYPGIAIFIAVLGLNLFGDGLRDILDPKSISVRKIGNLSDRIDAAKKSPLAKKALLSVNQLRVAFSTPNGVMPAVRDVSFDVMPGETIGIVGESGSGKSVTALSILRLIRPPAGKITGGEIWFEDQDVLKMNDNDVRSLRGNAISMIFQEPMTSLNPLMRVGAQIGEVFQRHLHVDENEARRLTIEILGRVGISAPERRFSEFPHQISGGMRQRIMIAMALACQPKLLIADEPTTALDVTIQSQILDIIHDLKNDTDMSMILISHDLGVVAEMVDHVIVMYAGQVIETGDVRSLFATPKHPYTKALIEAVPKLGNRTAQKARQRLAEIKGSVPNILDLPVGCAFQARCPYVGAQCKKVEPELRVLGERRSVRCHFDLVNGEAN